ncbi:MAG TPA: alpha/beta hydrolase [Aquabacterium sp.]|nr:alpha/beta hydrolase [Aquabacterium sp.]
MLKSRLTMESILMTLFFPAHLRTWLLGAAFCLTGLLGIGAAQAAPLLDRIKDRLTPTRPPVESIKDLAYGSHKAQRFDVYHPEDAEDAPVIFMVHGGAWRMGSKDASKVVNHKVDRWVPKGFVVVSVNYRMLPDADPLEQARDVAQALTTAQAQAADWGGDPAKFILMGHSAGAHLVALIHASPILATGLGAKPWLGAVLLDSAALDVVRVMEGKHPRLYDRAFGRDPGFWQATSPWHQMGKGAAPVLAVCSTQREDACRQADRYRDKAASLGTRASVLPQDLSHSEINARLGMPGAYTRSVEQFMSRLDPVVATRLRHP